MNRYLVVTKSTNTILTYENEKLIEIKSNPEILGHHLIHFAQTEILDEKKIKILEDTGGSVTKLDASFDDFWAKYPHKVGKKDALTKWAKMKEIDRQEAYNYLKTYIRKADKERVAYLYPASYLNSNRWEDEN